MKKQFADLVVYIRLYDGSYIRIYDGYGKPKLDWQTVYRMFPKFKFIAMPLKTVPTFPKPKRPAWASTGVDHPVLMRQVK